MLGTRPHKMGRIRFCKPLEARPPKACQLLLKPGA